MTRRRPLLALAMLVAMSSGAHAARLLAPESARSTVRVPGGARAQALHLDRDALSDLRGRRSAVVADFPLGATRAVTLELHRIEPFAPGARVEVMEADGAHAVPLPDTRYFGGSVRGDATSRVLLVAADDRVRGWVATGGNVYPFGADANGRHHVFALSDLNPAASRGPGDFCQYDKHREQLEAPAARRQALQSLLPPRLVPRAGETVLGVDVALDTDQELRDKFSSNAQALDYLGALVAAANVIYQRDVAVRIGLSYVRLWHTTDPWSGSDPGAALDELQSYWLSPSYNMNAVAGPHDVVHLLSGKGPFGGVAYLSAVCDSSFDFGVSQVYGSFDVDDPNGIWDVLVFVHELGHNLGTPHTHCYSPPLDQCYSGEDVSCWNGPESVPPGGGTIMSYCHLLPPGLPNVHLLFGGTVSGVIRGTVDAASCLEPANVNCGNGTVDAGEQCDDGNAISGDGCTETCVLESNCGDGVVGGSEQCDDGNSTAGDGCSPVCTLEGCGSGVVDPGETCDDGNAAAGDGCSALCLREPRCGDGSVDPGESCDDGNTTNGDGCSAACAPEPCSVTEPHQTFWVHAKLTIVHGGSDKLALGGRFGIAAPPNGLALDQKGLRLLVTNAAGATRFDLTLPGGARWSQRNGRWRYKDPSGSAGGIRLAQVRERAGGITEVDVKLAGRGSYPAANGDLPLVATLVLGDAPAGEAGTCGRYDFAGGRCSARGGGKKIACR